MIRRRMNAVAVLAVAASAVGAQGGKASKAPAKAPVQTAAVAIPAVAVGTWENRAMTGPKDSVVATNTTTFAADGKVMVMFPNRPMLSAKVIAAGGDSVTVEVGPYESVVKKGLQTTTRTTSHFKGNASTGTFDAKYSDGSMLKGKLMGARKAEAAKAPAKKP